MALNFKQVQNRIDEKRKTLTSSEDIEKLKIIEESIKIENFFFKVEPDVIVNMLKFLDFEDKEIVELFSSQLSLDKIDEYESTQFIIQEDNIKF